MKFYSMLGKIKLYWAIFSQFLYEMRNPDMKSVIENIDHEHIWLNEKIHVHMLKHKIHFSHLNCKIHQEFIVPDEYSMMINYHDKINDHKDEIALEEEY